MLVSPHSTSLVASRCLNQSFEIDPSKLTRDKQPSSLIFPIDNNMRSYTLQGIHQQNAHIRHTMILLSVNSLARIPSKSEANKMALRDSLTPSRESTTAKYILSRIMSVSSTSAWLKGIHSQLSSGIPSYNGIHQWKSQDNILLDLVRPITIKRSKAREGVDRLEVIDQWMVLFFGDLS